MDGDMFHHTSGEQEAFVCGLCGELGASALHKYWTCPRRNTLPDEDECISKSQWLKTEAEKGFQEHPCLWARAVLPHSCWHVSDPPIDASEVAWRIVGDMQGTVAASGEAFSDDAGAISGYRRCADEQGHAAASTHGKRGKVMPAPVPQPALIFPVARFPGRPLSAKACPAHASSHPAFVRSCV